MLLPVSGPLVASQNTARRKSRSRTIQSGALPWLAAVAMTATLQATAQPVPVTGTAAPLYDLERDERLGGHTIERHIGKSDQELAERLAREPQISAASTYSDLETAKRVVASTLARSRRRLQAWEQRTGERPNLVLNYSQSGGRSIGRSLARGQRVRTCTRALVVIRWNGRRKSWYVLTSYPEASR